MSKLLKAYDRSRVPLYIQVASVMRQRIEAKQWRPGEKISTLVELEQEFQVARVTVRQAIDILREEGLLRCQQGRGTFVAAKPLSRHWLKLATSWDVLVASIKDNVPKRIKVDNPPPLPSLGEGEGEHAAKYVFLRTVQYKDGEPYGIVNLHLASDIYERDPNAFCASLSARRRPSAAASSSTGRGSPSTSPISPTAARSFSCISTCWPIHARRRAARNAPGCRPRPRERRTEASDAGLRGCDCYHPKIGIIVSTVALIGSAGAERARAPASRRSCAARSIGLE